MAEFFKTTRIWVVDYRFDGAPRRWFKPARDGDEEVPAQMRALLADLYGPRAQLLGVRPADADEERQYLRGELPPALMCPTGRQPRSMPDS